MIHYHINDPNFSAFNKQIADYKAGKLKKADLIKQIAKLGYEKAFINTNGKKEKLSDVYGKQYDAYKKQGEDAKKNETPPTDTTAPATAPATTPADTTSPNGGVN